MNLFFEENKNRKDLGQRAVRSGVVAIVSRVLQGVLQFGSILLLARLLAPEDFGLVAIVAALTSFAPMLIDLGLGDATVQRSNITHGQISTLFWINLGLGSLVALVLVLASSLVASIYREPRLEAIAMAFALPILFSSLSVQHMALLRRAMRFKDIAIIEIVAAFVGLGTGIWVAVLGYGYWALVWRSVVSGLILAGGAWLGCNWKPGLPRFDAEVKSILKFGLNFVGGAVVNIGARTADRSIMGLVYAPGLIGFYQNAIVIYENALYAIAMPLHMVGVSALSKLRSDPALFREKYAAALSTISFYSMPAFATLAVIGQDIVPMLLGQKWARAGAILSILALGGIVHIVETSQTWLHLPLGRPDRWIRWSIVSGAVVVVAVLAGLPFGLEGVAGAVALTRGALAFPAAIYAGRPIDLRPRMMLATVGKQLSGAIIACLVGKVVMYLLAEDLGRISRIIVAIVVCLSTYAGITIGLFGLKEPLRLASSLIKKVVPRRLQSSPPSALASPDVSGSLNAE